jgi:hypothetical protein
MVEFRLGEERGGDNNQPRPNERTSSSEPRAKRAGGPSEP